MTGTSVGNALVGLSAAAVWAHYPMLDKKEVTQLLYNSGTDVEPVSRGFTTLNSHYGLSSGIGSTVVSLATLASGISAPAKQVRLCEAVDEACAVFGTCVSTPTCMSSTSSPDLLSVFASNFDAAATPLSVSFNPMATPVDGCTAPIVQRTGITAVDPCPQETYYSPDVSPWVWPQPIVTSCPSCSLNLSSDTLWI